MFAPSKTSSSIHPSVRPSTIRQTRPVSGPTPHPLSPRTDPAAHPGLLGGSWTALGDLLVTPTPPNQRPGRGLGIRVFTRGPRTPVLLHLCRGTDGPQLTVGSPAGDPDGGHCALLAPRAAEA